MSVCLGFMHVSVCSAQDLLELESWAVVNHLMTVLVVELGSSARTVSSLLSYLSSARISILKYEFCRGHKLLVYPK